MTIGTCAWMERHWMEELDDDTRKRFRMCRFMDDIFMLLAMDGKWDSERFLQDFEQSTCYHPPLKLEEGAKGIFLETAFRLYNDGTCEHWLKNDNGTRLPTGGSRLWRYQHFHSFSPLRQKQATMMACLRKVHAMSNDNSVRYLSALDKIAEFHQLGYPTHTLTRACGQLAWTTGCRTWLDVRDECIRCYSNEC